MPPRNDGRRDRRSQGLYYGFCNDYTAEAQRAHPDRLYGMGTFDPYAFEAGSLMQHLVRGHGFRGLKFETSRAFGLMGFHPELRLDAAVMTPIWVFAHEGGLVVSLDLGTFGEPSLQVEELVRIAADYPRIRFVVEHLFYPGPGRMAEVRAALRRLSARGNVSFTLASIPSSLAPEAYPFPSAAAYAAMAREEVGVDRLLWGSDVPSVAVKVSYRQLIDYVAESGKFFDSELRRIYAENAVRAYRLETLP